MPAPPSGRPPLGLYCTAGRSIRLAQRADGESRRLPGAARLVSRLSRVARRQRLDRPSGAGSGIDGRQRRAGHACRRRSNRALPLSQRFVGAPCRAGHDGRRGIGTCRRRAPVARPSSRTAPTSCARRLHGPRRHLGANPSARVAVVVTTAARRQDEIERLAAAELGGTDAQPYWSEGRELGGEAADRCRARRVAAVRRACSLCNLRPLVTQSVFCAATGRAVRVRTARRRPARRAALAAAVPSSLSLRSEGAARNTRTALGARARGCSWCHR